MVNQPIASVATMVADLSETRRIHHEGKRWFEKQGKTKHPADNKMAERGPIKVSHIQLWQDLILSGTSRENRDKLPKSVLLSKPNEGAASGKAGYSFEGRLRKVRCVVKCPSANRGI